VASIGTGASAIQYVPAIARKTAHLTVFQRTPIWIAPRFDFPFTAEQHDEFERHPETARKLRDEAFDAYESSSFDVDAAQTREATELARSYLLDGIPWLKAALLGRDFLYFAILLPLALRVRLPTRQLRLAGVLLLGGVALCAIGQDIQSITHVSVSWLAHPAIVDNTIGLSRLYSSTSLAINTALIFAVALLLSRESRAMRRPLAALVVLFFVDAAVGLTRANYFALAVALLAGIVFYAARYGSLTKVFVRVGITVPLVVLAVVAFNGIAGGGSIPAVHRVTSRASSGLSALFHATGTVGYREHVDRDMLRVLGHKWPVGLGFLHPGARDVPGVPGGTIRNADTGVFNALMTMGIVGVLLIYAPLLYGIRELVRASARLRATAAALPPWILYGGAAWIAWAIAGSPTLVTLFSVPGLVTSTVTLAALAHLATEPSRLAPGARRTPVAAGTYGLASTLAADAG
jgi:hypothetical protein